MSKKYCLLPVAAAACLVFFIVLPAMAQQGSQQQGQESKTESEVSDAELEKAAEAYLEVQIIVNEFQQAVQETQDPTARQQLQTAANQRAVLAVENAGLDAATYNNIMEQIGASEELSKKFTEKIQQLQ